ncbi:MAG: D-aminoacyl-tRNA deacylase [Nanoarchaeota archaeon]|nr:D-aminoacyl-tRNA deacylase [Nanoarchaeota archaeon]
MIRLIASKKDIAGTNIAKECVKLGLDVHFIQEDIIFAKELPDADAYIFLSRHKSKSELPCLTAHFPGNFSNDVSHGGNAKELGFSFPSLEKIFIRNLWKIKGEWNKKELEKYQVVIEATHHGPTHFNKPVMFVEIGSSEEEWKDEIAASLVAHAIKRTLNQKENFLKHAIAFGGTHYPEKFTNILLKDVYSIGHVMPKYALQYLDEEIFKQMIEKSIEKIKYCLIDWKGANKKDIIIKFAKEYGLEVVKV